MNKMTILAMISIPGLLVTGLMVFQLARGQRVADEDPVAANDIILKPLQDLNPEIRIEKRSRDRSDRIPVYWAIDPSTGRAAMLPIGVAEGKKVEFLPPAEIAKIPKHLLYPGSSEPVCLRLSADGREKKGFFIEVQGRLREVVTYYHNRNASARGRWAEATVYKTQPDGTQDATHAYSAYETNRDGKFLVRAFVVYEERY